MVDGTAKKTSGAADAPEPPRRRGGFFKNALIVLLLPFAAFGAYELLPFVSGIKKEVSGSGGWKNMYESLKTKWQDEGFDGVQHLLADAPEMKTGVLLRKAVLGDLQLKKEVTAAVVRLQSENKLTSGEGRALLTRLDEEQN